MTKKVLGTMAVLAVCVIAVVGGAAGAREGEGDQDAQRANHSRMSSGSRLTFELLERNKNAVVAEIYKQRDTPAKMRRAMRIGLKNFCHDEGGYNTRTFKCTRGGVITGAAPQPRPTPTPAPAPTTPAPTPAPPAKTPPTATTPPATTTAPATAPATAPTSSAGDRLTNGIDDVNCSDLAGPIPTPVGDEDNLDSDGDGTACEGR